MSVYVFLGPSLELEQAHSVLDAIYLPPVRQGDVYRLVALRDPRVIAIVDGYFNQVPAVWHKEILWAMSAGVHVFGAASMGALRAAELAAFGMQGVGRIFEAYRDGVLPPYTDEVFEDDDEVAVLHSPPEAGYGNLSDAMVNMRCTLAAASAAGVISRQTRSALVRLAKEIFYAERGYRRLLARAGEIGLPGGELAALRDWLPEGKRNQKRDDALELLQTLRRFIAGNVDRKKVTYRFQHTAQWEAAVTAATVERPASEDVLDELRLQGTDYFENRRAVRARLLGLPSAPAATALDGAVREALEMPAAEQFDAALKRHHREPQTVAELWRREQLLAEMRGAVDALPQGVLDRQLLRLLAEDGRHASLEARARAKQEILAANPVPAEAANLTGLRELQLHDWYFEQRLGIAIPEDVPGYAADLGFASVDAFNDALLREYFYIQRLNSGE